MYTTPTTMCVCVYFCVCIREAVLLSECTLDTLFLGFYCLYALAGEDGRGEVKYTRTHTDKCLKKYCSKCVRVYAFSDKYISYMMLGATLFSTNSTAVFTFFVSFL